MVKQYFWVFCTLLGFTVLAGIRAVSIPVITAAPAIALFPAVGTPTLIPPLRFTPLGHITWGYWLIDIVGVAVLLLTAYVHLQRSSLRYPKPSRARAFQIALTTSVMALLAANIVRMVLLAFVTEASLGVFSIQLGLTILISLITGIVLGAAAGSITAVRTRGTQPVV